MNGFRSSSPAQVHRAQEHLSSGGCSSLVLFISSPRGKPPPAHWSRVLHCNGGPNQYKSRVPCVVSSLSSFASQSDDDSMTAPPLYWGGYPYLSRPWSSSEILSGKGANNGHFEGEHLVQVILTKGGLRLPKALAMTPSWAPW